MGASNSLPQPESQSRQHQQPLEPSKNSTKAGEAAATATKPSKGFPSRGRVPHNYEHILKDADSPVDKSSSWEKLLTQLYAGVFLDNKTKKYWLEENSNANCFMLYARALSITWGESPEYWKWVQQKEESSGAIIEMAKLKMVCWLEVRGKFDTGKLTPGIVYQVSFKVMLKDSAEGWEDPINVRLVLPGKKLEHKENLNNKSRERWIEIQVGEFLASESDVGEMEISLYEFDCSRWKTGLHIQGVSIKPKN